MSTPNITPPHPDAPALAGPARVAAIIRGDQRPCACVEADVPIGLDPSLVDMDLVCDARSHGVQGLVRQALRADKVWERVAPDVRHALDTDAHQAAITDAYLRRQTARAVFALQSSGVPTLVFKGEALACTHYASSYLRPRVDTDLLIAKCDIGLSGEVLAGLGYIRPNMVDREAVHAQRGFVERTGTIRHVIDLHWRVSNQLLFASSWCFDELADRAIPLSGSVPRAMAPGPAHALLLACVHRVAHHDNSERLIWLFDIHLLANGLSAGEWEEVLRLARAKALCRVCAAGLELASDYFGASSLVDEYTTALRTMGGAQNEDPSAYLAANVGRLRRFLRDARYAGGLGASLQLLAGHAFPDVAYMRRAYGVQHPVALAGAYLHRAVLGFRRLTS